MNVLYIRTSTELQEPELQIADLNSICNEKECLIMSEQKSAWRENVIRPEFEKIKQLISTRKIQNLYVWDLDRLYRNRLSLMDFFLTCKIHGCKVHSFNQQWLETIHEIQYPFNDIMLDLLINLLGWLGQEESEKKSARVKMAVRRNDNKPTLSYKGNRWGRKPFSMQTIDRVITVSYTHLTLPTNREV